MKIGIFGSAQGVNNEDFEKAKIIGREVAKINCTIITGACPGIVNEAVLEAKKHKKENTKIIGYSPYENEKEHLKMMEVDLENYDKIIYTNAGKKGRNLISVMKCTAGIFVKGRIGTLNEFTIAYDGGVHCAVLEGMGGTSDLISEIVKVADKKSDAQMFYHSDPVELVKLLNEYLTNK